MLHSPGANNEIGWCHLVAFLLSDLKIFPLPPFIAAFSLLPDAFAPVSMVTASFVARAVRGRIHADVVIDPTPCGSFYGALSSCFLPSCLPSTQWEWLRTLSPARCLWSGGREGEKYWLDFIMNPNPSPGTFWKLKIMHREACHRFPRPVVKMGASYKNTRGIKSVKR